MECFHCPAWAVYLAVLLPCSLAGYGRLGKILDFLAATEHFSVTNIRLTLNPKHNSYWEEN